jgi:dnd system-associated protein 4
MRGVRREKRLDEAVVRRLTEQSHSVAKGTIFPTLRDALCFAAFVGFENNKPMQITGNTVELDGRTFAGHQPSMDTLLLIALAHTKDMTILREDREDEALDIFEQFVNGGLRMIEIWLSDTPEDEDGDRAILNALRAKGYLDGSPPVEAGDVTF